ncbi:MAG TPA: DUF4296 domain-containing protein [Cyclobacteriaceae bacterium]|nr:DUF4296 domain-containing protein [Cyclobacteriaceae bacterium]
MQKLWIIFLFIGMVSCHPDKKPEGILTQPQLSALLVEIYLAEARVDQVPVTKDSSIRFYLPFEEKLLKRKGITDSLLKKTYTYYLAHPKELEQVYDAVIDTLALREQRIGRTILKRPKGLPK